MTAREYLNLIIAQWRWIVGAALVGLVLAWLAVVVTPKTYAASVTFYVSTASNASSTDAYQGSLLSQDRVKSYTELLSSYRLGQEVATDLKLPDDPQAIADEVSSGVTPNTVLLTATVTDRSPERAQAIAGAVGRRFPALVADLERPADRNQPPAVSARVVEGPVLEEGPVSPRPSVDIPVGLAAGLIVGIVIAVLRRSLDRSVLSLAQLARLFPRPLLGTLPRDRHLERSPLFLRDRPTSPAAESLRTVRANADLAPGEGRSRVVTVTSAVEGEGKSTLLANLALAEAAAGARVLVVEGDLRRPRAAGYLGLPAGDGLSSLLAGRGELAGLVRPGPVAGLEVLASGPLPQHPYELVASDRMEEILAAARERYDLVLVDAPPVLPVADGLVLARRADSIVFVVRAGSTGGALVRRAYEQLQTAGLTQVGVVLNGVTTAIEGQYSGNYHAATGPDRVAEAPTRAIPTHRRARGASVRQPASGGSHRTPTNGIPVGDLVGRIAARDQKSTTRPVSERSS